MRMPNGMLAASPTSPDSGSRVTTASERYGGIACSSASARSRVIGCALSPSPNRSVSEKSGQRRAASQLGFSPTYSPRSSTRPWKSRIHSITSGSVRSSERTTTLTSPRMPVSSCSSFASASAGRLAGARSWTSEMTSVRVPATQPHTASTIAAASTLPGRVIETASERSPIAPIRAPAASRRRDSRLGVRRAASRGSGAPRHDASASAAKPAVAATTSASAVPSTSSSPNERTIGIGESTSAANPAAVAKQAAPITGPPLDAARVAALAGCAPSRRASLKRAWNWIA